MIKFNEVTWYSKLVAVVLAVMIFYTGFYFGGEFQKLRVLNTNISRQSISDDILTIPYNTVDFSLAIPKEQILARSYIPACDDNFDYCFYYNGNDYKGTNFESAGIRIKKRTDLVNETKCLTVPPLGYDNIQTKVVPQEGYSTSVFSPIGDAGMGHYAEGLLYRLFVKNTCYEFETRIGSSQFANYEPGTIKEFTVSDRQNVKDKISNFMESISVAGIGSLIFPKP
jgi:hypothetical protein